jgi:hypothetical protein
LRAGRGRQAAAQPIGSTPMPKVMTVDEHERALSARKAYVQAGYWARCRECSGFMVFSYQQQEARDAADEHDAAVHVPAPDSRKGIG